MAIQHNRRYFFKVFFSTLFFFPLKGTLSKLAEVCPQEAPSLERIARRLISEKDKKRLDYFADWKKAKEHAKFTEGSNCANCSFYKAHKQDPTFGRCTMAAMKYVPSCGWCKLYKKLPEKKST